MRVKRRLKTILYLFALITPVVELSATVYRGVYDPTGIYKGVYSAGDVLKKGTPIPRHTRRKRRAHKPTWERH